MQKKTTQSKPAAKKTTTRKEARPRRSGYAMQISEELIESQISDALDWENEGQTAVPGMSYEQGVLAALRWITGETPERPIEETVPPAEEEEEEDED